MTHLDEDELRSQLNRLYDEGFSVRELARACNVADNALSSFRRGSRWGADRLARLKKALETLQAQRSPSPSPSLEPTNQDDNA